MCWQGVGEAGELELSRTSRFPSASVVGGVPV